jgi:hypothetical protein
MPTGWPRTRPQADAAKQAAFQKAFAENVGKKD